jgi:hypothetical protein
MLEINLRAVVSAANGLESEGKRVSIRAVRDRLGARGSHTTIARCLQAWKRGEQPSPEVPRASVPDAVAEAKQCYAAIERRLAEILTEQTRLGALLAEFMRTADARSRRKKPSEPLSDAPSEAEETLVSPTMPTMPAWLADIGIIPEDLDTQAKIAKACRAGFSTSVKNANQEKAQVAAWKKAIARAYKNGVSPIDLWNGFCKLRTIDCGKPTYKPFEALDQVPQQKHVQERVRREAQVRRGTLDAEEADLPSR